MPASQSTSVRRLRVGMLINADKAQYRRCVVGAARYAAQHRELAFQVVDPGALGEPLTVKSLRLDGLIVMLRAAYPIDGEQARSHRLPFVNLSDRSAMPDAPWVGLDDVAIGAAAVEHLIGLGYRSIGFAGYPQKVFSCDRLRGACLAAEASGIAIQVYEEHYRRDLPGEGRGAQRTGDQVAWLRTLPLGTAIFAANDRLGAELILTALAAGFDVPGDLAVIGVGDDEVLCHSTPVPMSSVIPMAEQQGWRAAEAIHQLLTEHRFVPPPPLVPLGVASRLSTDASRVDDPAVAQALAWIQAHATKPRTRIEDLARAVGLGRRALEVRFKKVIGRAPLRELMRLRMQLARRMLIDSALGHDQVAHRVGFRSAQRFRAAFQSSEGMTVSEFQRRYALD
jgi:LacI family transcriptional regulator